MRVSQLNTILLEFSRVLRVLFSSVETAFTKGLYSVFIDSLLTYLFRQVLSAPIRLSSASSLHSTTSHIEEKGNLQSECSSFVRYSQYVQAIPLSNEHMTMVGKKLSDFESSNFADMSENFYGCRRQYAILGSAFFYSGHLVCSHLATEDLHDLQVYLQHLGMMELMTRSSVAQFIVWREIFPSRFCHDVAEINNTFGYSEPSARWCWLIVGLKRGLFCCLLETVCPTLLHQNLLSPDIFYIDQAKACLMQIQTPQLLTMLDTRLNEDSHSTFAKSDYCATYVNTSCEKMTHIFNDEHKIKTRDGTHHRPYLETSWGRSSVGSDFSVNSMGTESLYKSLHRGKIYPIGTNGATHLTSSAIVFSTVPSLHRLSKSQYPSIYQYCCLDGLEGTVILGSDMISSGIFHCEIVHCFYQCCRQIHDVFTTSADKRLRQADAEEDSTQFGTIKPDTHLKGMKEHGVLMTLKQSHAEGGHRNKETVEYWVVGRRLKRPYVREMYICFHASASQSVVELAFTHSFGSSL